jgi:hypothetical protein
MIRVDLPGVFCASITYTSDVPQLTPRWWRPESDRLHARAHQPEPQRRAPDYAWDLSMLNVDPLADIQAAIDRMQREAARVYISQEVSAMPVDPRIEIVIKSVRQLVERTGGGLSGTVSPEQLLTLLAASAADQKCREALVGLIYGAVAIANKTARDDQDRQQLEAQMRASLSAGTVRRG